MAGFQPFPIPRRLRTTSFWFYLDNKLARQNLICGLLGHALMGFAIYRYLLIRKVTIK